MNRESMLARVREHKGPWDFVVIGGGATGAGVAVDAASRGYSVLLLEREDFGKGTSSRSTKLVHGGVRYLQQGNLSLVKEALHERGIMLRNAPHLVHDLEFVVPSYSWWEKPFYGIGLKTYDLLAGRYSFGKSKILSSAETSKLLPEINRNGLRGGVVYHDGQFDDARMLIALMMTAAEQGAAVLNYAGVIELLKDANGFLNGVVAVDGETGESLRCEARVVVNATGSFADEVRRMADPGAAKMIAPSQGIHLIFDKSFLGGSSAIMVPRTSDRRLLFAIPWHEHLLVGTTDQPVPAPSYEPVPLEQEIQFILETVSRYLTTPPKREDILSAFAGIRPLVRSAQPKSGKTSTISRDHTIEIDAARLITITGGKWTTYRRMAEDTVNQAARLAGLKAATCKTRTLSLHGSGAANDDSLSIYGSDAAQIKQLAASGPELAQPLDRQLPYIAAEVVWAAREEMARTLDDALSRRTRALPLNARASTRMAPVAAKLLARELGKSDAWADAQVESFRSLARHYDPAHLPSCLGPS